MNELSNRPLGNCGIDVSAVGLGTVKIGRNQAVKYPRSFDLPTDKQVKSLLDLAQHLGINFLDTAPAYGESEERLGKLLRSRKNWILCTKVGEEFDGKHSSFDFTGKHVKRSVERSLRRLKTDYLDLVLVHSDGNDLDIIHASDCLETLSLLKQSGHIRAFGMSTKTVSGGLEAVRLTDVVMITYNLSQQEDASVIDAAEKQHKGILIKKGLASGHVVEGTETNEDGVSANLELIFAKPGVSSVVIGTINPTHLRQNVEAATRILNPPAD